MEEILDEEVPDTIFDVDINLPFPFTYLKTINENQNLITVDAMDIIENLSIWNKQRLIQESHVKEIVNYQTQIKEEKGKYNFINPIYICGIKNTNYSIIDGQHRLTSINYMLKKNPEENIELLCWIINVDNEQERIKIFQNINLSRPICITDLLLDNESEIINETCEYLYKKYKSFFTESKVRIRRPNISLDKLKEEIHTRGLITRMNIRSSRELIQEILDTNIFYSNINPNEFPKGTGDNNKLKLLIVKKGGLYLGMFPNMEWMDKMIEFYLNKTHTLNKVETPNTQTTATFKDTTDPNYKIKVDEPPPPEPFITTSMEELDPELSKQNYSTEETSNTKGKKFVLI